MPTGSTLGLLGINGAGKSTTIRMLMGLLRPNAGEVIVLGRDMFRHRADLCARVGYVPEHATVYRWMTVKQVLRFCSAIQPKWDEPTAQKLLGLFRLDPNQRVRSLSKGMTTKLHLLLALAHRPEVLILDEPLSGLDPIVREDFVDGVLANICEHECTVLFSSHHVADVQRLADRVAIIHEGSVLVAAETESLLRDTRRLKVTLAEAHCHPAPPSGTIYQRQNRRLWELTVMPFNEEAARALQAADGVTDVQSSAVSLEDLFKDLIRGREAPQ